MRQYTETTWSSYNRKLLQQVKVAKTAARILTSVDTTTKNRALREMAQATMKAETQIIAVNARDIKEARRKNLKSALIDRLVLDHKRLKEAAQGLLDISRMPDPVGKVISTWRRPNGMLVGKMRVPLGVVCVIYEARPNVTVDAVGLTLKSGNAVILRGGSEAINSNLSIGAVLSRAGQNAGLPAGFVEVIATKDRRAVNELIRFDRYIDLVIPRGSEGLIRFIRSKATVPVIGHGAGNCHIYVDKSANMEMALRIVENAKVQRPAVCNAMETLLVHKAIAPVFLPLAIGELKRKGVEIRGCSLTRQLVRGLKRATEEDWGKEYLDLILAVKVVKDVDEAIEHIERYGSHHTDAIITEESLNAKRFIREVDSAAVMVNVSTRFTDGAQFGMGAEIGISNQKLHARGPMGLEELTSVKFFVKGRGQVRE